MRIKGARVVITGSSSGLGAALADALAGRGARLVLAGRDQDRLSATATRLGALAIRCDVAHPASVRALIDAAWAHLGGLDLLVNNAGQSVYGDAVRTAVEDFETLMRVNFFGPLVAIRAALPVMRGQGAGLIVNVASVAALRGVPFLGAYGASKAALANLSECLSAELAASGVRILTVYPDYIDTALFGREGRVGGARRPDGPYAPPATVARAILRAIERDRTELIVSARGRALAWLRRVAPRLVAWVMARTAAALRTNPEASHG